jgi:para-nitrobenzyl esterase
MNTGSASWPLYDFTNLAHHNEAVVVSVNHRLGILGFLDLSRHHEDYADSGNVGMLDIVAALAWIRDNITAFGGDADNVTVFGESGGGAKVNVLLAMPAAQGLFHRAFVMSGTSLFVQEPDVANDTAAQALTWLECAPDAAKFSDVAVEQFVDAEISVRGGPRPVTRHGPRFTPTLGPSLPVHPINAVRAHSCERIEIVVGCTTHEMLSFLASPDLWTLDEQATRARLHEVLGTNADGILDSYRSIHPSESPSSRYIAIVSDWAMRLPHIRLAEAATAAGGTAYMYLFAWGVPGPDGVVRSGHGADMPFCFDNVERAPVTDGPHAGQLTNAMSGALVALARTGDPNHDGLPAWPEYDAEKRATMRLDVRPVLEHDPLAEERRAWDTIDERELGLRA